MSEKEQQQANSSKIAGRTFEFEDYNRDDEVSSGLAVTHEQISDNYTTSALDSAVENMEESKNQNENNS
ncbi:YozQ family protein [Bacillus sp. CECT 9360]|uniref:YozQ family protein n=1 Tax=Bacillus sp. CECT 9360 TaxID=2845821 RepID=UPI001E2DC979|nr:YozQ family protein [Bacillus sp. CECT 9360]CAH0347142.1 hypothetical protein BCI9360_03516 [Bacillus sp. CECT 9360]